jgi:hypothetical protein
VVAVDKRVVGALTGVAGVVAGAVLQVGVVLSMLLMFWDALYDGAEGVGGAVLVGVMFLAVPVLGSAVLLRARRVTPFVGGLVLGALLYDAMALLAS